jgi:DNA-binding MarR family transcriptional regulator
MSKATDRSRPPRARTIPAGLCLDNQLCFALYATSLAMTKVYRPLLAPLGLTYPQYLVMLSLWEHGELSAGGLGERVALDSGTLVPLIRKLVSLGLVARRRSTIDDRSVLISLTAAGAALRGRARAVHDQVARATSCASAQRRALTQSLRSLRTALLQGVSQPAPGR